jgi:hypothetical protein
MFLRIQDFLHVTLCQTFQRKVVPSSKRVKYVKKWKAYFLDHVTLEGESTVFLQTVENR